MGSLTHFTDFVAAVASMSHEVFLQSCPFPALVLVPPQTLSPAVSMAHGTNAEDIADVVEQRLRAVLNAVTEAQVGFLAPPKPGVEPTIGRHSQCAAVVRDSTVSLHHAEFAHKASVWRVTDLESANGTFVEQRRLAVGIPQRGAKRRGAPVQATPTIGFAEATAGSPPRSATSRSSSRVYFSAARALS